jgi:hypothetical protein
MLMLSFSSTLWAGVVLIYIKLVGSQSCESLIGKQNDTKSEPVMRPRRGVKDRSHRNSRVDLSSSWCII